MNKTKLRNQAAILSVFAVLAGLLVPVAGVEAAPAEPSSKMVAARQHFFGKENVDPKTGAVRSDKVILSWFSVSNYAAAFNGHVVLLDSWVARGSYSDRVPTNPDELAALAPEFIFVGHGDFDHAADAAEVAVKSGATIVGTKGHCDSIREQAGEKVACEVIFPADPPPGLRKDLRLLPGVGITAVTHVHSSFESPEQQDGGRPPCPPPWDPVPTAENPPSPEDMEHFFSHLGDSRGGNILYQFRVGNFALAWHDTTGKLKEDAPKVIETIKTLPPTDVQSGSVLAFGQVTNCLRSLGQYLGALHPKVYMPSHHDNFTWGLGGGGAESLKPYVEEELGRIPEKDRPKLLYSYDPDDYLNYELFTFDPTDKTWR
jgi:hypothetical protein